MSPNSKFHTRLQWSSPLGLGVVLTFFPRPSWLPSIITFSYRSIFWFYGISRKGRQFKLVSDTGSVSEPKEVWIHFLTCELLSDPHHNCSELGVRNTNSFDLLKIKFNHWYKCKITFQCQQIWTRVGKISFFIFPRVKIKEDLAKQACKGPSIYYGIWIIMCKVVCFCVWGGGAGVSRSRQSKRTVSVVSSIWP